MNTLYDVLSQSAEKYPENPLFMTTSRLKKLWELETNVFNYQTVLEIVSKLKEGYASAGYGNGHRIAFLLENRPYIFFHFVALNALGVGIVPINPDYKYEEISYLLDHSEAEAIICIPERLSELREISKKTHLQPPVINFEEVPDRLQSPKLEASSGIPNPENEAALLYTSGTTGRPKGCILTNEFFFTWGKWYLKKGGLVSLREGCERLLQPLPTFHTSALAHVFMGMLFSGGCQIILDRFHPRTWWADAIETGATAFHYMGVMPAMLLNIPPCEEEKNHNMRYGLGGGVDPAYHAAFEERFGCPLLEGWAMTETGGAGAAHEISEPRHVGKRCIGSFPENAEVSIVDEHGAAVTVGEPGELLIRRKGPDPRKGFFSGYLKDEKTTEEAWAGGWFHTGDIMRQEHDGSFYFVDRKKNIIRRSGENIASAEIELIMNKHPMVSGVAVIAAPDKVREEEVLACILLPPNILPEFSTAEEIFNWCFDRMAYFKAPGYIAFLDSLPTTATQKVKKNELKSQVTQNIISSDHCYDFRDKKRRLKNKK